ncbi:hypothetical protein EVAR_41689_1 [Eumeta japonica]|uniref:Uncharacterized protein n=1 Tax=Eumeta variegata TaxID=151549 RepID=A0A4C1VQZ3_EUMVA|nr:hypothetical protein EVAR_41689_1 [Eumeta japonica]
MPASRETSRGNVIGCGPAISATELRTTSSYALTHRSGGQGIQRTLRGSYEGRCTKRSGVSVISVRGASPLRVEHAVVDERAQDHPYLGTQI